MALSDSKGAFISQSGYSRAGYEPAAMLELKFVVGRNSKESASHFLATEYVAGVRLATAHRRRSIAEAAHEKRQTTGKTNRVTCR